MPASPAFAGVLFSSRRLTRRAPSATTSPRRAPQGDTGDVPPTVPLRGTPCFTDRVSKSPMSEADRQTYITAAAASFRTYLSSPESESRAVLTLRVPQLDPSSDVYCRRFLLSLTWALVRVAAAERGLRTRILVQAPGNFYGGLPLSVAGLSRFLAADWAISAEDWPPDLVRLGELGERYRHTDDDEVLICVAPTNAIAMPVVQDLQRLVENAGDRRIVLVNPRLDDVPSHSGVMQVAGRKERIELLQSFRDVFTCRLLYRSGTVYPVEGVLYHSYPGDWQVWKAVGGENEYERIGTFEQKPNTSDITDAFARHRSERERKLLAEAMGNEAEGIPLPIMFSTAALGIAGAVLYLSNSGLLPHL